MHRTRWGLIAASAAWLTSGCGLIAGVDDFRAEDPTGTGAGGATGPGGGGAGGAMTACGDAKLEGVEECDGPELGDQTCVDVGTFYGGALACTAGCTLDTSGCFAAPTIPVLRKPMNNTYRPRFAANALEPHFEWETSSLPAPSDPTAEIEYHLQYGPDATFASSVQTVEQGQTTYPPTGVAPDFVVDPATGAHFYWRVKACVDAVCSAYSRVWHLHLKRSPGDLDGDGYDDLVITAPWADDMATADVGAVSIYPGSATLNAGTTPLVERGSAANDVLGIALAGAGDVNGDGFGDLLVNAPGVAAVHLYLGGPSGPFAGAPVQIALTSLGSNVAAAGDVTGDGYGDIVVGLPDEVRLYPGGPTFADQYVSVAAPAGATAQFGVVAGAAGDLDGDGFADLVLTDYLANASRGHAWIFLGDESGQVTLGAEIDGPSAGAQFGFSVSGCDANDDGFSDLAISTPTTTFGHVYLYMGGSLLDVTDPGKIRNLPAHDSGTNGLGVSLGCGDVNGDGFADFVIGAPYGGDIAGQGAIQIHRGSPNIPASFVNSERRFGLATSDWLGHAITVSGDLNGDGITDIAAGAPGFSYYSDPHTPIGYARVFFGAAAAPLTDGPNFTGATGEGFGHLLGP